MLELGSKSNEAHASLGYAVAAMGINFLAAFGSQAENMAASARDGGMAPAAAQGFNDKKKLASWLKKLQLDGLLHSGDWILVKGSRGMRMEEVIELLRENSSDIKAAGN